MSNSDGIAWVRALGAALCGNHADNQIMERLDAPHGAPRWNRGLTSHGCALLCIREQRAELATMLILQELGLTVDLAADVESAVDWVGQARYDLIVVAGAIPHLATVALRLRHAAPRARIVLLADTEQPPDGLEHLRVEVLRPPLDVNALMEHLGQAG